MADSPTDFPTAVAPADSVDAAVLDALLDVAPDIDPASFDRQADLRDACDIDSMDFLNLVTRLSRRFDIKVPPADYPRLDSFDAIVAYVAAAQS